VRQPHGWLVIDKPVGPTSAGVVGRLKAALRRAGVRDPRIGHGGTLDPLAEGVLPVALGEATKLAGYLLNGPKAYRFAVAFGAETDSGDRDGTVVASGAPVPDRRALEAALAEFRGAIRQRPPLHSALKVGGKRGYVRARAGEAVALPERSVEIFAFDLLDFKEGVASLAVRCSKGTYVRSLARDLARAAGSLGTVVSLRRTEAGPFGEADALPLDKAVELVHRTELEQALLPLAAGLDDIPVLAVDLEGSRRLRAGQRLFLPQAKSGLHLATDGSVPVAMVEVSQGNVRVLRGINME
jgi:tRNA pseudouridine55 synthase